MEDMRPRIFLYVAISCLRVSRWQGESIFRLILLHFFELFALDLVEYQHIGSQLSRYKYVFNLTEAQYDRLGGKHPYPDDPWCYGKLKSALLDMGRPLPGREIDALYEGTSFSNLASSALHNRILTKSTASRKQIADDPILHDILLRLFLKYLPHVIATISRMTGKCADLHQAMLAAEQAFRPASFNQTLNPMPFYSLDRIAVARTA